VEANKIKAKVKGVAWSYERLSFPKVKDNGLASVILGGYGARVGVKLKIHRTGLERMTQLLDSYCIVDRLDVTLYDCQHATLYHLFHRTITRHLKKAFEQGIAEKVAQMVDKWDRKVVSSLNRMNVRRESMFKQVAAAGKRIMRKMKAKKLIENRDQLRPMAKRHIRPLVTKARRHTEAHAEAHPQHILPREVEEEVNEEEDIRTPITTVTPIPVTQLPASPSSPASSSSSSSSTADSLLYSLSSSSSSSTPSSPSRPPLLSSSISSKKRGDQVNAQGDIYSLTRG